MQLRGMLKRCVPVKPRDGPGSTCADAEDRFQRGLRYARVQSEKGLNGEPAPGHLLRLGRFPCNGLFDNRLAPSCGKQLVGSEAPSEMVHRFHRLKPVRGNIVIAPSPAELSREPG
jgi:hypothetical protein